MSYDQAKDKLIKLIEMKQDKTNLMLSIFSYDGGLPKLGITRSYQKRDNTVGYNHAGRMTLQEVIFLRDNLNEIINIMEKQNS